MSLLERHVPENVVEGRKRRDHNATHTVRTYLLVLMAFAEANVRTHGAMDAKQGTALIGSAGLQRDKASLTSKS